MVLVLVLVLVLVQCSGQVDIIAELQVLLYYYVPRVLIIVMGP